MRFPVIRKLILCKLAIMPTDGLLGFKKTLQFKDILNHLSKEKISKGYTEKIMCDLINEGILISQTNNESHHPLYKVDKKKIIEELSKDEMFILIENVIKEKYSIMIE